MEKERLIKFYERNKARYDDMYRAYQDSGDPKYMYSANRYRDYVDIAEAALSAADDRKDAAYFRSALARFYEMACRARFNQSLDMHKELAGDIIAFGENEMNWRNRYK